MAGDAAVMEHEWTVGDKVAVSSAYELTGPHQITEVGKRKIKVSDGSEWTNAPWPSRWGESRDRWPSSYRLEVWGEAHDERLAEQRRAGASLQVAHEVAERRRDLTWPQIKAIRAALGLAEDAKP